MQKEISHYHYNEVKKITFTYFKDGSFDTAPGDIQPKVNTEKAPATDKKVPAKKSVGKKIKDAVKKATSKVANQK